jgi:NAD(P)-dependent dehydrogenase (short-subunit alcohol dehydrogenase family)
MTEATGLLQDLNFGQRRVLITGAAHGFGAAIAARFAEHGATLVLADIEEAPLAAIAARLGAEAHTFDQSDPHAVERLAQVAGEIDILINNAGILVAKPLLETSLADVRRLIDTDLVGVIRLLQLVGRGMVERRRGVIVSIGSQTAFAGGENRAVYAAAKAAISQLTRAAAVEWGPYGVRVVCLAPGRALTRMTEATASPHYTGDRGLQRVPLGRWGTPEEISKLVLLLASDAAGYVTGETLIADGGYVIG